MSTMAPTTVTRIEYAMRQFPFPNATSENEREPNGRTLLASQTTLRNSRTKGRDKLGSEMIGIGVNSPFNGRRLLGDQLIRSLLH
jgi:hypothetical protein